MDSSLRWSRWNDICSLINYHICAKFHKPTLLLFFSPLIGLAQINLGLNNSSDPIAIPTSPNSTALAQYGDVPVNLYNGLPQIGIPLHTLDGGSIQLPISLSYHASGIKVSQMSGNVGLGWSLQAGGSIYRVAKGLPDDLNDHTNDLNDSERKGYFLSKEELSSQYNRPLEFYTTNWGNISDENLEQLQVTKRWLNGKRDFTPDEFGFSFLGYSGKFYLEKNGSNYDVHMLPHQDLKIEVLSTNDPASRGEQRLYEWKITTPDGTQFFFGGEGATERTLSISRNISFEFINGQYVQRNSLSADFFSLLDFYSTWHLKQIITTKGDQISFVFKEELISEVQRSIFTR